MSENENDELRGDLLRAWDGMSEYVILGDVMYRVIKGDDPIFIPEDVSRLADSTSGGFTKAPPPKRIDTAEIAPQSPAAQVGPKQRKAPKISDVD